jgi:AraC-like DNA-binding protein
VSTMDGADLTLLTLEAAWTQDFAAELLQREGFRLRFHDVTPRDEDTVRYWSATVNHLRQDVLGNDEAMRFPLIRAQAARRAATALLWSFPGTFHDHDPSGQNATALPGPVHRAVAFIDEHLAQPVGLAEIAAAAWLTPSQLILAFRQHLGTTPGAYLRITRLDAVHHDLLNADPSHGATVAAIAHRWGASPICPGSPPSTATTTGAPPPAPWIHRRPLGTVRIVAWRSPADLSLSTGDHGRLIPADQCHFRS